MSDELLQQAAAAVKSGDRQSAIKLTKQFVRTNPKDARGWYALARLSPNDDVKRQCLERVLALRPDNAKARQMLAELDASTRFDVAEPEEEEEAAPAWMQQPTSPFEDTPAPLFADDDDEPGGGYFAEPDPEYEDLTSSSFIDAAADAAGPDFSFMQNDAAAVGARPAPAARPKKSSSGGGEWLIGLGLFMLVIVVIGGLAFYAYRYRHYGLFGLLGPDLNQVAQTTEFQIRYPGDWEARIEHGGRSFVSYTANATELAQSINVDQMESESFMGFDAFDDSQYPSEETVAVVIAPITQADLDALRQESGVEYASFQQYLEAEIGEAESQLGDIGAISGDGGKAEIEVDGDNIGVGGEDGYFGAISMDVEVDFGGFGELKMQVGAYMAAFQHNGTEYGFVMVAMGDGFKSHKRTARRMLRTVEFLN